MFLGLGFKVRVSDRKLRAFGLELGIKGLRLRVEGIGFRV
jgi:hypothetical protein